MSDEERRKRGRCAGEIGEVEGQKKREESERTGWGWGGGVWRWQH